MADLPREHGFEPLRVEGRLPDDLLGTLYRNGPSLFSVEGQTYRHWFDGDGAVSAVRFDGNGAQGAVKVVQSAGLRDERSRGKPMYGVYGTRPTGNLLQRVRHLGKNNANTSVMMWQGRLFALMEGGAPTELSVDELATLGESNLEGVITRSFSAHPHRVPQRKASYNFTVRYDGPPSLELFELPDAGPARRMGSVRIAGATMIHDFIATNHHLIFFAPPLRARIWRLLLGMSSFGDSLEWKPEAGTEVVVVPIDRPSEAIRFTVEPFYQWHFANAFERGQEIVVDYVRLPDFDSNRWLGILPHGVPDVAWQGRYHRAVLDLGKKSFRSEEQSELPCEFPRISSRVIGVEHRHIYVASASQGAGTGVWDQLTRFDAQLGRATSVKLGEQQFPSEPVFVPKATSANEDDGYLLTLVYDGLSHQSHVAVLDAAKLERGPMARAYFDHHIPFTFHGNFVRAPAH
jgi:all-trans-8'-apo-beta-carotenal 15,15'-oxygenase